MLVAKDGDRDEPLVIDPMDPQPSYVQLADQLRSRIERGTYKRGGLIPSLRKLMAETSLADNTVQKAIDVLEAEGLVQPVRGRGTFVR